MSVSGDDGELIRLTKQAVNSKNFNQLDFFIKREVGKYLYNQGRGENVNKLKASFLRIILKSTLKIQKYL